MLLKNWFFNNLAKQIKNLAIPDFSYVAEDDAIMRRHNNLNIVASNFSPLYSDKRIKLLRSLYGLLTVWSLRIYLIFQTQR